MLNPFFKNKGPFKLENILILIVANNEKNFIIKIDVQGYDEVIFQEIPENILKNTKILFIEITPLQSKKFNLEKLNSKLKIFSKINNFNGETFHITM